MSTEFSSSLVFFLATWTDHYQFFLCFLDSFLFLYDLFFCGQFFLCRFDVGNYHFSG